MPTIFTQFSTRMNFHTNGQSTKYCEYQRQCLTCVCPSQLRSTEGVAMLRTFLLASIDWFDFLAKGVLEAMVVCLMRIGEALQTNPLPKKLCRDDIRFVYKKQSVRARKAG